MHNRRIIASRGAGSAGGFGLTSGGAPNFICATGGTIVECGDYKTHIFTGPGTFTVNSAKEPANANVDYFVVAGGGGTGGPYASGGGAGGFRVSNSVGGIPAPTMSPLSNPTGLPVSVTAYPITVGAGGTAVVGTAGPGGKGNDSVFSSITSTGGGGSGFYCTPPALPTVPGKPGGSGSGGGTQQVAAGLGNQPPVSPPQGNNGGVGSPANNAQGGGGGAGAAGGIGGPPSTTPGIGGAGSFIANSFIGPSAPSYGEAGPVGSTRYFAGGGAGGSDATDPSGVGGVGGGGDSNTSPTSPPCGTRTAGVVNTGGGGGGGPNVSGKIGGSGIVMIRYKFK